MKLAFSSRLTYDRSGSMDSFALVLLNMLLANDRVPEVGYEIKIVNGDAREEDKCSHSNREGSTPSFVKRKVGI